MNIAVCAKQIPDPALPGRLDSADFTLDRSDNLILDESDMYGIEMALQLRDASGSGEVVLISMAPDDKTSGLRTALAMGADRAVLVSDPGLHGSDALSTARVLAAVVSRISPDIVLAATESTDGYTGTVPVQVAEFLGLPSVSFAKGIEVRDGRLFVARQTEAGFDDVECPMPAMVTVTAGLVEPRYPSFRGIAGAKNKSIEILRIADLELSPEEVGQAGAREEITGLEQVPARQQGELIRDEGDAHERVIALLEELKIV